MCEVTSTIYLATVLSIILSKVSKCTSISFGGKLVHVYRLRTSLQVFDNLVVCPSGTPRNVDKLASQLRGSAQNQQDKKLLVVQALKDKGSKSWLPVGSVLGLPFCKPTAMIKRVPRWIRAVEKDVMGENVVRLGSTTWIKRDNCTETFP